MSLMDLWVLLAMFCWFISGISFGFLILLRSYRYWGRLHGEWVVHECRLLASGELGPAIPVPPDIPPYPLIRPRAFIRWWRAAPTYEALEQEVRGEIETLKAQPIPGDEWKEA